MCGEEQCRLVKQWSVVKERVSVLVEEIEVLYEVNL